MYDIANNALQYVRSTPLPIGITSFTQSGMGFEADQFTNWMDECWSWKKTCYVGDWSGLLLKIHVKGPDALAFFSEISINSFETFEIGQAKHIVNCNPNGKVMGEGILMRLGEEEFYYTSTPGVVWAQWKFATGSYNATMTDVTGERFIFQIQGPNSLELLEKITGQRFREAKLMRFQTRHIDGAEVQVLRQGMAGELGFELHGNIADSHAIWNRILAVGEGLGIRRLGTRAKMVNHVEACFPTPSVDYVPGWLDDGVMDFGKAVSETPPFIWKHVSNFAGSLQPEDISELYFSPIELGWGKSIKFDHDFIGRAALEREVESPRRKIVTLVWNADDCLDVARSLYTSDTPYQQMEMPRSPLGTVWADKVMLGDRQVGIALSRCFSVYFKQMISLCVIDVDLEVGADVSVIWGSPGYPQKSIRATVAKAPYKEDRRRVDVTALPDYLAEAAE